MVVIFPKKLAQFQKGLVALKKSLEQERNEFVRDSIIQRFEFSSEMFWKTLKVYLLEEKGIDVRSPKDVMREARNVGLMNEEETELAIQMINDRNQTSHTYDEDFALEMIEHVEDYAELMENVLGRLI